MTLNFLCRKGINIIRAQTSEMLNYLRLCFFDGFIANIFEINLADGFAMFLITMNEGICVSESKALCKQYQCSWFGWHGIGLLIMHDLNVMLDGPQQSISIGQNT